MWVRASTVYNYSSGFVSLSVGGTVLMIMYLSRLCLGNCLLLFFTVVFVLPYIHVHVHVME